MKNRLLSPSELILNPDGSIYHLHLTPSQVASTIITVGDPDRVADVTQFFDEVTVKVRRREFHTQTGTYRGKRITVISTGIGTDNIDIVFNELDALKNIDFASRQVKKEISQLTFIRIGTSGAIQEDIPVDSFLVSEKAVGFDNLLHFYENTHFLEKDFAEALVKHTQWNPQKSTPYVVSAHQALLDIFSSKIFTKGVTATNVGFYGPQGRKLRLALQDDTLNKKLTSFIYKGKKITNLEMETSGIYGLSHLLGHRAISLNAILANRITGHFSKNPSETTTQLIKMTLDIVAAHEKI